MAKEFPLDGSRWKFTTTIPGNIHHGKLYDFQVRDNKYLIKKVVNSGGGSHTFVHYNFPSISEVQWVYVSGPRDMNYCASCENYFEKTEIIDYLCGECRGV